MEWDFSCSDGDGWRLVLEFIERAYLSSFIQHHQLLRSSEDALHQIEEIFWVGFLGTTVWSIRFGARSISLPKSIHSDLWVDGWYAVARSPLLIPTSIINPKYRIPTNLWLHPPIMIGQNQMEIRTRPREWIWVWKWWNQKRIGSLIEPGLAHGPELRIILPHYSWLYFIISR